MAVQLIFALVFGGNWKWVAELSGFAAGFVVPAGRARLWYGQRRRDQIRTGEANGGAVSARLRPHGQDPRSLPK